MQAEASPGKHHALLDHQPLNAVDPACGSCGARPTPRHVFRTRRLGLRHYTSQDLDMLRETFADDDARTFYPDHHRPEVLQGWIERNVQRYRELGFGLWALELLQDGRFVGDAGLTLQTVEGTRMLEVGYHIHPSFRRRGLATEAAAACIAWAFENTAHDAVCSIVDPRNAASIGVASRLYAGHRQFQGKTGHMLLFSTVRETWGAARGSAERALPLRKPSSNAPFDS